ncbi:MAG: hypothetical protein D6761_11875 [Candidatus Dadabacteria bacterium]|nr:MAG: hypothetical protein D6761_11875 [Candidatus Dadabacteria bacterium]
MEAILPDTPEADFSATRQKMGPLAREMFVPSAYDDGMLRKSVPLLFDLLNWLPVLCFWLIWRPLPFTRLSLANRQRLLAKLEHSRLYAFRGLLLVSRMYCCMLFFHFRETWDYVGYDGAGQLDPVIVETDYDRWRKGLHDVA